jgi:GDP-4-dehydro-6-deoxy-D-mannose reductase
MSDKLDGGAIFNVASGRAQVIGDILDSLLQKSDRKIDVIADPARQRAVDIPLSVGDASLARNLLGWRPRIAFDQTLADVLQYFRGQTTAP